MPIVIAPVRSELDALFEGGFGSGLQFFEVGQNARLGGGAHGWNARLRLGLW